MTKPIDPWSIPLRPLHAGSKPASVAPPPDSNRASRVGFAGAGEASTRSVLARSAAPAAGPEAARRYEGAPDLDAVAAGSAQLRPWHAGPAVAALQEALNLAGAELRVDGLFGPQTRRAVASLQRQAGLDMTGRVDAETWTAVEDRARDLRAEGPSTDPSPVSDRLTRQPVVPVDAFEPAVDGAESVDLVAPQVAAATRERLALRLIDHEGLPPPDAFGLAAGAVWVERDGQVGLRLHGRWHGEVGWRPTEADGVQHST